MKARLKELFAGSTYSTPYLNGEESACTDAIQNMDRALRRAKYVADGDLRQSVRHHIYEAARLEIIDLTQQIRRRKHERPPDCGRD